MVDEATNELSKAEGNGVGVAADLKPTVSMVGLERFQAIRVLNNMPRKGTDANDTAEEVLDVLEADGWSWEGFLRKGMAVDDPRQDTEYQLRASRKVWRKLHEDIKTVIDNSGQNQEPTRVTRILTRLYHKLQKVI